MDDDVKHERELRELWQVSHDRFHALDKEAIVLARKEVDRRLEEMNQFREQIARERGEFLRRDFYDEQHDSLRNSMDTRLKLLEQNKSNIEGRMWMMGAAISGLAVGLNLLFHYLGK